jgi:hypothetical protein
MASRRGPPIVRNGVMRDGVMLDGSMQYGSLQYGYRSWRDSSPARSAFRPGPGNDAGGTAAQDMPAPDASRSTGSAFPGVSRNFPA